MSTPIAPRARPDLRRGLATLEDSESFEVSLRSQGGAGANAASATDRPASVAAGSQDFSGFGASKRSRPSDPDAEFGERFETDLDAGAEVRGVHGARGRKGRRGLGNTRQLQQAQREATSERSEAEHGEAQHSVDHLTAIGSSDAGRLFERTDPTALQTVQSAISRPATAASLPQFSADYVSAELGTNAANTLADARALTDASLDRFALQTTAVLEAANQRALAAERSDLSIARLVPLVGTETRIPARLDREIFTLRSSLDTGISASVFGSGAGAVQDLRARVSEFTTRVRQDAISSTDARLGNDNGLFRSPAPLLRTPNALLSISPEFREARIEFVTRLRERYGFAIRAPLSFQVRYAFQLEVAFARTISLGIGLDQQDRDSNPESFGDPGGRQQQQA